ncbi:MAG TPA: cyclic pyranopterin monophosphate synthase MoaC [Acidimicrobiales bacterium]|nr:cyclic pyranopterin monophosphate synthase MoaC [Acidimicrobiales bacterium]
MTGGGGPSDPRDEPTLTHLDAAGRAHMVDVTGKSMTERRATARCVVRTTPAALAAAAKDEDVVPFARAAGIHAAKQAPELIPLCHPLPLDDVDIDVDVDVARGVAEVRASTSVVARTGIEIEAMTACGLTGLTLLMALRIYDPDALLTTLSLWHKSGGRSGTWERVPAAGGDRGELEA